MEKKKYARITVYLPNRDYKKIVTEAKKRMIPVTALVRMKLGVTE